jgi:site-specific DNA recombinase
VSKKTGSASHTGGSCYGYTTIPEPHPQNAEHPRAVVQIEESEAEVVRRVFRRYSEGTSLTALTEELNRAGIPAPADGRAYKKVAGWSRSQLFYTLRNERYIGRMVWNRREWFRDPLTKHRRSRIRPESEWVRTEQPALAIVDRATWEKVQARHRQNKPGPGMAGRTNRQEHLLSGLLRCGVCGGLFSITISRYEKVGRSWASFGCSTRHGKGRSACSNSRTISEAVIDGELLQVVLEAVRSPKFEAWVAAGMALEERAQVKPDDPTKKLEAAVRAQAARVEKVAEAIATIGCSETLARKLREEEAKLRQARAALARVAPAKKPADAGPKPTVEQVLAVMRDVERVYRKDPRLAREALASVMEPVLLHPTDKGLKAEVRLTRVAQPAGLITRRSPVLLGRGESPGNTKAAHDRGGLVTTAVGCGARI